VSQCPHSWPGPGALEDGIQLSVRDEPQDLSLLERAVERVRAENASEVKQRARRTGDRHPVMSPDIARLEPAAVSADPVVRPCATGTGDVDWSAARREHAPEFAGGAVTERRARSARE